VSYTFPVPFKATPVVVAVVSSTSTVPTFMKIKSVTTTGFIARVFEKADNTFPAAGLTIKASWIAFNTAPGSS
jgi:hypothetical protein